MKIVLVQFTPVFADPVANRERIDKALARDELGLTHAAAGDQIIFVLPEMAFTGYMFSNLDELKKTQKLGRDDDQHATLEWAKSLSSRFNDALVQVGLPRHEPKKGADNEQEEEEDWYNSIAITCPGYRSMYDKHFLYEVDERWAQEGDGFRSIDCPPPFNTEFSKLGFGICMDLNPYRFEAPFEKFEFANFHVQHQSDLILCSMSWVLRKLSDDDDREYRPEDGPMPHIRYWCHRLMPLIKSTAPSTNDGGGGGGCRQQPTRSRIIVAIANRVGSERGDVVFCGSSCVLEFKNGGVKLLGCLDHRQEAVLILNLNDADAMPVIQQL